MKLLIYIAVLYLSIDIFLKEFFITNIFLKKGDIRQVVHGVCLLLGYVIVACAAIKYTMIS